MTAESVKGLVDLAGVVTGVGVDRAKEAIRTLLTGALEVLDNPSAAMAHLAEGARSGAAHAEDSVENAAEGLAELIRTEIDRAAARFGFVREEELAALRARVQRLEAQVATDNATGRTPTPTDTQGSTKPSAPKGSKARSTTQSRAVKKAASTSPRKGQPSRAQKGGKSGV